MTYVICLKSKGWIVKFPKSWGSQNFTRFSLPFSSHSKCIRNLNYREHQKRLSVFETWRPACPLGGVFILTANKHNGFGTNCFKQHIFPWKFSGQCFRPESSLAFSGHYPSHPLAWICTTKLLPRTTQTAGIDDLKQRIFRNVFK